MGNFDGQVLPGARASTSNADTTGEVSSGVSRAVFTSSTPAYPTATVTDINGARYRATMLESGQTVEYLLWANSSGPLTVAPGATSTEGNVTLPTGTLTVNDPSVPSGVHTDGTRNVVLTDNGGASISSLTGLTYVRGGTTARVSFTAPDFAFDPVSGMVTLNDTATVRGAVDVPVSDPVAVSFSRGDTFTLARYTVGPATFNWTRNDPGATRFGWNAAHRKWEPYKGGPVKNLGKLLSSAGSSYTLSPVPSSVGGYLPGSDVVGQYAMLRLGNAPDESSYPVVFRPSGAYSGVLVVTDDLANASYDFSSTSPPLAGVMGSNSGKIAWNPAFLAAHEGETIWYSPRDFAVKNDGAVGPVTDPVHYLAPIPGPTERPILRIGNRAPLTVIPVANETALASLALSSGSAGVALSTGRVKLYPADVARANPSDPAFDPLYLGASLRYDGLALNLYPQPVQSPVALTPSGTDYLIPDARGLPGTGTSGIVSVPDGTGNEPNPALPVTFRPGASGLVRALTPGFGDSYLFTDAGRVSKLVAVNRDSDLPGDLFSLSSDTAYVSLDTGRVRVGYALRQRLSGKTVYFAQTILTPASYPDAARIFSRLRDVFSFTGTETFEFSVDGTPFAYTPPASPSGGTTATTVAASLNTLMGAAGTAGVLSGYLYISSNSSTGSVSVGFSEDGCRAMGLPPGWRVTNPGAGTKDAADPNWLPDTGVSFGLSRSPNNLDGSQSAPDVRATYRVTDAVLSEGLQSLPYQLLNYPPREDIAGYGAGEFFALSGVASPNTLRLSTPVKPWKDVVYQFDQSRFAWLSTFSFAGQVQSPVSSINLGNPGVVPATFYPAMGGSLKVSATGGSAQSLTLGTDFLVPPGSGEAVLVTRIGALKQSGYRGSLSGNTLTDTSLTLAAASGDRLKVTSGANKGSYTVESSTATTVTVTPNFPAASLGNVSWELYDGVPPGDINPAVLGDAVYRDFNHLSGEPYEVRLLTPLGTAPSAPSRIDLPTANSGRSLAVRYGLTGANFPATILTGIELGTIANGALNVPTAGDRFTTGSFSVVVGTRVFENGVDLLPVPNFSSPILPNTVEYRTTDGELRFGSAVLANYQSATAVYREEVMPSANVPAGTSEVSPFTGAVSVAGLTSHTDRIYLVDLQTFESVFLNPILGSFSFARPVQTGQLVEVTYYRAVRDSGALYLDDDGNPVQVTEFLPVTVRREVATRVNSQFYTFNAAGRTLDTDVSPSVYVGSKLVSYGIPKGVSVDTTNNTLSLVYPVNDPATRVLVTYGVFEALGGETSYTVSQGPVWRPPFRLEANVSTFRLDRDRTPDMVPGKILRIGNYLTYVKASSYSGLPADITTVTVFPTPVKSVGTLAPSEPPINLLTDRAITPAVDPAGSPVATGADAGFLPRVTVAYGLPSVPVFQPITKGQTVVRFEGDLTRYAVAGHVLELFGIPFLIAKGEFVEGSFTDITLGSPSPVQMVWTSGINPDYIRISVRPIYSEGATVFLGAGAFVETEPYEVVLYESTSPGATLNQGRDYQLDPSAGTLTLLEPRTRGLPSSSSLRFYRTSKNPLAPFLFQGTVQYPRVSASAGYIDPPSETNGRLGATLTATYTFDSPDCFYVRSLPLPAYISETAKEIVRGVTRNASGTNPSVGGFPKSSSSSQGTSGLTSQRQDLVSRDRVTRTFLRYFNGIVTSFEQVLETIDGNPVGDRDGKMRLWMGTEDKWTPPGYEDGITGAVNPRNVWNEVWNGYRTGSPVALLPSDPIVNPLGASLTGGVLTGESLPSNDLGTLQSRQYHAIRNDVDDVVLTGLTGTSLSLSGFVRFRTTSYGVYRSLSEPSAFSRLYPELTQAFTTTDPGLGYDPATGNKGVYTFGQLRLDLFGNPASVDWQSTNGKSIARLENPVRGNLTSVLGADVRDRLARARVIAYYPNGVDGVTPDPVFLATVLPLDEFPLLPDGTPDVARLVSVTNPSGLFSLESGDPSLHTPPFLPGQQLAVGTPDGTTYGLGYSGATQTIGTSPVYPGVFVRSILQGCYLTLQSYTAPGVVANITDPATVLRLTGPYVGTQLSAERGDTLYVVPTTGTLLAAPVPPTTAPSPTDLQSFTASLPGYRTGTDLGLDGRAGHLVDASLPSWSDPFIFGLKEITGQRPPAPVSNLQARVTFQNSDTSPSNIPALRGQTRLDSGDYSLPYYQIGPTELDVLGGVFPLGIGVASAESPNPVVEAPAPGYPPYTVEAVYPDEILDNSGKVANNDPIFPATLKGSVPLDPSYAPHSGVGTVQEYDLFYVQEGTGGLARGATGIHSVGAVDHANRIIEPPRFVTQTSPLYKSSILVENIQAWTDPTYATGLAVTEDTTVPGTVTTTFTLTGVPTSEIVFDDGMGGGVPPIPVGGFNTYFTLGDAPNKIRLKFADTTSGAIVLGSSVLLELTASNPSITACSFNVSGDNGASPIAATTAYFLTQTIVVVTAAPFFDFATFGGFSPFPGITQTGPLNFSIDADSGDSVSGGTASMWILPDRLTFVGTVDTRSARPRGATTPGGSPVECALTTRGFAMLTYDSATASFLTVFSSLNNVGDVNGGVPFTFSPRSYVPSTYGVGAFFAGFGALRVMSYEGWGNTPVNGSGITYSAAPSSRQNEDGALLTAITVSDRTDNPPYGLVYAPRIENRFIVPTPTLKGNLGRVLPGDIVVVKGTDLDPAFPGPVADGKAGTHLVRGVMVPNSGIDQTQETFGTTGGDPTSWLPFTFPTVTGFNLGSLSLAVSEVPALPSISGWLDAPVTQTHIFPTTGRVYVVVNEDGLNSTDPSVFSNSVVSAAYTGLNTATLKFTGLGTFQDALGNPLTAAQFDALVAAGQKVSGFTLLPMNPHSGSIPSNLPGYTSISAPQAVFGIRTLRMSRASSGATLTWDALGGELNPVPGPGPKISVYQRVKQSPNVFVPSLDLAVYDEVPGGLQIIVPATQAETLHTPAGAPFLASGTECFLPGDRWEIDYSGAAGIYVEPSFPRTANDLSDPALVNVVDAGNSLGVGSVGMRQMKAYTSPPPLGNYRLEISEIEVRRPRRFHDLGNSLGAALASLRYCYEIRRGVVSSVISSGGYGVLTALPVSGDVPPVPTAGGTATQLGDFTDSLVNVRPGDEVRFLDASGEVYARAEVAKISGSLTVTLSRKVTVNPGDRFEVYLRTPPVPHEQSNEELLGYATDRVILNRPVDYVSQTGGKVSVTNTLRDTDPALNYADLDVLEGDILLVDPAGALNTPSGTATPVQHGRRPYGDNAVFGRSNYTAEGPVPADDNRGYYRVVGVSPTSLVVAAFGGLAGNNGADVTFGTGTNAYAVYPTIHASGLTGGTEGQMDLRPTSPPVGTSYTTTFKSVEPFAYRVIRPTTLLSTETVELILAMRERMLSWMEEIRTVRFKYGTYFVFQRDRHLSDLGLTTDPESGRGILTNPYLFGIVGNWEVSSFSNVQDGLSLLDRRFWCLDFRLDSLTPPYGISSVPYANFSAGEGRPVEVDRINEALEGPDKLRSTRYSWLNLRVNRITGTLENIRRFDVERPRREAQAEQALLTSQSVEKLP